MLWPEPPSRITLANFDRIRPGMSRTEVAAMLGGPPGDYRTIPTTGPVVEMCFFCERHGAWTDPMKDPAVVDPLPEKAGSAPVAPAVFERWQGDTGCIDIHFSPQGAGAKSYSASNTQNQSRIGVILWRLKRLWHRWFPE
jgi:hypothetical protein